MSPRSAVTQSSSSPGPLDLARLCRSNLHHCLESWAQVVLPACGLASVSAREAAAIYLPAGNFPDPQQADFPWVWAAPSGAVYHGQRSDMGSP